MENKKACCMSNRCVILFAVISVVLGLVIGRCGVNASRADLIDLFNRVEKNLEAEHILKVAASRVKPVRDDAVPINLYKKNLSNCDTPDECMEIFRFILELTHRSKARRTSPPKTPFKWG